jgi:integrase
MSTPRKIEHSRGISWEITYRLDGRMVRQRFATKALALDAVARARSMSLDGMGIAPVDGKTTLAVYTPRWVAAQQCRPTTIQMYSSHIKNHILPALGRRPMSSLRRSDISAFVAALTDKKLAPATLTTVYRILAMILRSAVYDRILAESPCYKIKLPSIPPKTLQALAPDEVGRLLDTAIDRDYAVLALGVATGMRQGEVLGLRLPHLRLLARELSVEQQARFTPGIGLEITSELKTKSSRRILPLPDFAVTALARHLEVYGLGPQDLVFSTARGHIWSRGHFNHRVWKPALQRAGLPHTNGYHSLRHTYASSLIAQGIHARVIQARLGHASIVETMDTYGHLFPDANEETTRALDTHYAAQLSRPRIIAKASVVALPAVAAMPRPSDQEDPEGGLEESG